MRTALAILIAIGMAVARPASADHTWRRIRQSKVINLGYEKSAPPFSSLNDDGSPTGYSIELCEAIIAMLREDLQIPDLKVHWFPLEREQRIDEVVHGTVDLVCGNVTATLSRERRVDFSHLIYVGGGGVLVATSSGINSIEALAGRRVAVMPNTTTHEVVKQFVAKSGQETEIIFVTDPPAGVGAVDSGKADAFITDRIVLQALVNKFNNKLMVLDQYTSYEPIAFPMRNNDPNFRQTINSALSRIYRTPQINVLVKKWLSPTGKHDPLLSSLFLIGVRPD